MKISSTGGLHRALDDVYAVGLLITFILVSEDTYGDASTRIMTLTAVPIILTVALVKGHDLVARHEGSRSHGGYRARRWLPFLVIYILLAFVVAFWAGFDTSRQY